MKSFRFIDSKTIKQINEKGASALEGLAWVGAVIAFILTCWIVISNKG